MIGWIISAFLLAGWFSTVVCCGFKLIQVKAVMIRLAEKAGVDSAAVMKEVGLDK